MEPMNAACVHNHSGPSECLDHPEVSLIFRVLLRVAVRNMEVTTIFYRSEVTMSKLMGILHACGASTRKAGQLAGIAISKSGWRPLTAEFLRHLDRHDPAARQSAITHLVGEGEVREQVGEEFSDADASLTSGN
jgi:hypothetical protein